MYPAPTPISDQQFAMLASREDVRALVVAVHERYTAALHTVSGAYCLADRFDRSQPRTWSSARIAAMLRSLGYADNKIDIETRQVSRPQL